MTDGNVAIQFFVNLYKPSFMEVKIQIFTKMPSVLKDSTESYFGGQEIDRGENDPLRQAYIGVPGIDGAGARASQVLRKLVVRSSMYT
jgi:hypothetical protein